MATMTVEYLLGGSELIGHHIQSDMDMYELSRKGLPKKALLNLCENMNMSLRAIVSLLHITERTIQRKSHFELLDEITSAQLLQIAEIYSRGIELFNSKGDFKVWINSENTALGYKIPFELLSSPYGVQMVLDELGRIEHGVFV